MKRWRSRSGPAKVDLYTRGTVYSFVWLSVLVVGGLLLTRPVRADGPAALVLATALVDVANGVFCHRLARRAMDTYLRRGRSRRGTSSRRRSRRPPWPRGSPRSPRPST